VDARRTCATASTCLVTLLLAACWIGDGRSAEDRAAEKWFHERQPLASCGEIELRQGEPEIPPVAVACMDTAFGSGAELVVTSLTIEGDPIVAYYRVGPGIDGLEIYRDNRDDAYRGSDWDLTRCPGTTTVTAPQACVSTVWGE
jgi:hypothetical protein